MIFVVAFDRGDCGIDTTCADAVPPAQCHLGNFGKETFVEGNGVAQQLDLTLDIGTIGRGPVVRPHDRELDFALDANALDVVLVGRRHQDQFVRPVWNRNLLGQHTVAAVALLALSLGVDAPVRTLQSDIEVGGRLQLARPAQNDPVPVCEDLFIQVELVKKGGKKLVTINQSCRHRRWLGET